MTAPGLRGRLQERARLVLHRDLLLGTVMDRLAAVYGDSPLVEEPAGLHLTYEQGARRVQSLAGGIAASVRRGDLVVIAVRNGYDMLLCSLAAARAGAVAAPVNPLAGQSELDHIIADANAALVIRDTAEVLGEPLPAAVPASPDDLAAVFYTSGTTGRPKGVELTHHAVLATLATLAVWPIRDREAVIALPVAHIMGFIVLVGLAMAGVRVYMLPRFHPVDVLDALESRRSHAFVGVPAMYRLLLEAGAEQRDLTSVRLWGSGADAMPPDLARRFQKMGRGMTLPLLGRPVGRAWFAEGYGMVETAGAVAAKLVPPVAPEWLDAALGMGLPPNKLKVVGADGAEAPPGRVGELWVKGPGVLAGYRGDPDATAAIRTGDGWVRTGDLARRGPWHTILFAGRAKDVVKHGGYSVYAVEVERALEEHPEIAEAAVLGLPDERLGEVPVAAVRLRPGSSAGEDELLAWAQDHLSGYKVPKQLRVVHALPRTGTNKVAKAELVPLFSTPS